ncbi:MAG: outer membrane beta-barrel protein [Chitinophagaceae bacterium]|nr:outer membrane beta-barrel protein [Chitinophagaceae bacterium]
MKSFKIILPVTVTFVFLVTADYAQQGRMYMNINYGLNMPTGSFQSDVVSKASYLNWNANILYGLSGRFSAGLQTGYNSFKEKFPRALYNTKEGTVSAVLTNAVQAIPVLAKVRYNLSTSGIIQPYVGAGVGGNLVSFNQYLGEFSSGKTGLYFAASPEAGLFVPFGKQSASGITIGAHYNYMPFKYGDINNLNNWGVYAGLKFPLR